MSPVRIIEFNRELEERIIRGEFTALEIRIIYLIHARGTSKDAGAISPSLGWLAGFLGCRKAAAGRSLRRLTENSVLTKALGQNGQSNSYRLTDKYNSHLKRRR